MSGQSVQRSRRLLTSARQFTQYFFPRSAMLAGSCFCCGRRVGASAPPASSAHDRRDHAPSPLPLPFGRMFKPEEHSDEQTSEKQVWWISASQDTSPRNWRKFKKKKQQKPLRFKSAQFPGLTVFFSKFTSD